MTPPWSRPGRRVRSLLGQGIGTALVAETVTGCRDEGYRRMIFRSESDNQRALDFYEYAQGWPASSRVPRTSDGLAVAVWELELPLR